MVDEPTVIERTRRWISDVVIGLNLCPFARRVFEGELIRYTVSLAVGAEELRVTLTGELLSLRNRPATELETAFLIHPNALLEFPDYNDFVVSTDEVIEELGLRGVVQIAGFHPRYQFAGTKPDDVENYTNRSPFPMLHLLREDSITAVNDDPEKLAEIPRRNIDTLRRLGLAKVRELQGERRAVRPT